MKAELVIPTKPGPRIGIPQLLALNLLEQGQEELSLWRPLDSTKVFVLAASFYLTAQLPHQVARYVSHCFFSTDFLI
jgi:hypothetical protein